MNPSDLGQLGATLATVVAFIWYLTQRDKTAREASKEGHAAAEKLSESIASLSENQAKQNEILRQIIPERSP